MNMNMNTSPEIGGHTEVLVVTAVLVVAAVRRDPRCEIYETHSRNVVRSTA